MIKKNKQFSTKLIVFICILILGIILILVDNLIVKPRTYSGYGYLTIVAGFIIFLGVMMIIRGLILLRRARLQEN
jgi:hypothetical protein